MTERMNAHHPGEPENLRDGERREHDGKAVCNDFSAAEEAEDEEAMHLARVWREGKVRVWAWLVDRLEERLASGRSYASMRSFTDDVSQNHDFVDDCGRKVAVPHNKGLGRGIALLMVDEHPEFAKLFRMRSRGRKEA